MIIEANNPSLKSWVEVPANPDFPIQNLPFGIISIQGGKPRVASRIGDFAIDIKSLFVLGDINENVYLSSRNLKSSKVINASELNTYGILNANIIVFTEGSLEGIHTNLNK